MQPMSYNNAGMRLSLGQNGLHDTVQPAAGLSMGTGLPAVSIAGDAYAAGADFHKASAATEMLP